jgi:aspartate--ammonia ligase
MNYEQETSYLPKQYSSKLDLIETEIAIKKVKDYFETKLSENLNLMRVSAPLFVTQSSGLNDNLNGVERPVAFDAKTISDEQIEIVQSLAKWKRMALHRYGFKPGTGLYTDMNAIRRDEDLDHLHSVYVDQWDWEKVLTREDRNEGYLKNTVNTIYKTFKQTEDYMHQQYSVLDKELPDEIFFVTTQELEDMYPTLCPKDRENEICRAKKAVFIMKIGGLLDSGEKHDGRAPDYDDWELNGDIVFWNPVLESAFELSSMGIRVDEKVLRKQLKHSKCEDRVKYKFHSMLLNCELPLTVGGGIGQSRICMYFLEKAHIGEVQSSIWPESIIKECEKNNIFLL